MPVIAVRSDTRVWDQLIRDIPDQLERWLAKVADQIKNDLVVIMNSGPAGRTYIRSGGRVHVASQPGYPPNIDTGALAASFYVQQMGKFSFWIYDGERYGVMLELGTTRMAARPFVNPTFDAWRNTKLAAFAMEQEIIHA